MRTAKSPGRDETAICSLSTVVNVRDGHPWAGWQAHTVSTGQSVRPEPGPGRTAVCRPVRSFSKVARQVRIKDEDGRHSVVPSGLFWNLPHTSWGLSSFLMTAVLEIQGRGRTAFCRPVSSRGLGSPPAGPYGGPGRLRTPGPQGEPFVYRVGEEATEDVRGLWRAAGDSEGRQGTVGDGRGRVGSIISI